jgi:hypothetical protein
MSPSPVRSVSSGARTSLARTSNSGILIVLPLATGPEKSRSRILISWYRPFTTWVRNGTPSIVTSGFSLVAFWFATCSATRSLMTRSAYDAPKRSKTASAPMMRISRTMNVTSRRRPVRRRGLRVPYTSPTGPPGVVVGEDGICPAPPAHETDPRTPAILEVWLAQYRRNAA